MRLGAQPWLRAVFLAATLVFAVVAVYVYAFRFFAWLESDAAVPVLLAAKALHAKSPVVTDWYYANGELWVLAPHLLAILPTAIFGVGPIALFVTVATGFVLEIVVLVKVYLRVTDERWIAMFATVATLMAWSNAHVAYAYIQLAYGFATCTYMLVFVALATAARPRHLAIAGLLVALISVQVPARAIIYVIAPVFAGCAWPWRDHPLRRRLAVAGAAVGGWLVAFVVYNAWLAHVVAWSNPRGHVAFALGSVQENLATLARGLVLVCAGRDSSMWAIPGALVLAGALALVGREVLARTLTPLRWMCVVVLAQLGAILAVLLIGNLLDSPEAVRYLIPSLLAVIGLAVVIAVRETRERWRRFAIGWLVVIPIAAMVAAREVGPPAPMRNVWPDAGELERVADELVHRGLTHGFAGNLAANLLTLDSKGEALTCRITLQDILMPQRWLASTECYTALPDRFFVVAYQDEADRGAIRATLPPPLEQFHVGDTYEVYVFRTEPASTAWLDLPIPDGARATFPIRLAATHLQIRRSKVALDAGDLVATGESGTVVYGPYIDLEPGSYVATWIGHGIDTPGQIMFSVVGTPRSRDRMGLVAPITLDASALPREQSELARLAFSLKRPATAVELAVESTGGARVALHELVIARIQ